MELAETPGLNRPALLRRRKILQYLTIGYNCLEGVIALVAGFLAGSVALVMVPIIAREGIEALRGKTCCAAGGCH